MEFMCPKDVLLRLVIALLAISNNLLVKAHLELESDIAPDSLLTEIKTQLSPIRPRDTRYAYCYGEENCTGEQYCNVQTNACQCFEPTYVGGECPTVGAPCTSCCCGQNVYCADQVCEVLHVDQISNQMIMSIVMVMGIVSIVFMVYRMCYKNTLAQRILLTTDESQRPSLSSLQVGVMARMRDRPPLYETRHNYQVRAQSSSSASRGIENRAMEITESVEAPVSRSGAHHPQPLAMYDNTPPPPYNDDGNSEISDRSSVIRCDQQAPPPYSVAIKTISLPATEQLRSARDDLRREGRLSQPQNDLNYKELYI